MLRLLIIVSFITPWCMFSQEWKVEKMPFNSQEYDEFGMFPWNDKLVYVSNKKNTLGRVIVEKGTDGKEKFLNDLYFADSSKSGKFRINSFEHNSLAFHEGPATISQNGMMIFTKDVASANKRKHGKLALYQSEWNGTKWSAPQSLSFNNPEYNFAQPSISPDGKTLLFSSDQPGGKGYSDIWKTEMINGKWQEPMNLSEANSADHDIFPFYVSENEYFFSSDRTGGNGGYDIYMNRNGTLENVDEPINSRSDDFAYITISGTKVVFSSNRDGTDDVFSASLDIKMDDCLLVQNNPKCFQFSDLEKSDSVPNLVYHWDFGDGSKGKGAIIEHCYDRIGVYEVKMILEDSSTHIFYDSVGFSSIEILENSPLIINKDANELSILNGKDLSKNYNSFFWMINGVILGKESTQKIAASNECLGYIQVKVTEGKKESSCFMTSFLEQGEIPINKNINIVEDALIDGYLDENLMERINESILKNSVRKIQLYHPKIMTDMEQNWLQNLKDALGESTQLVIEEVSTNKSRFELKLSI